MRENAQKLHEMKDFDDEEEEEDRNVHYEEGLGNIRKDMMKDVKKNRNHKKYKHDDSD